MPMLVAAALAFLAIHFVVSGTKLRDAITAITGEGPYLGLFSLASLVTIAWLAISYNRAQAGGDNRVLYDLGIGVKHAAIPLIALAFFLGVQGLFLPNPTSVRGESLANRDVPIRGVMRITRHPFLWGAVIWSAFHMPPMAISLRSSSSGHFLCCRCSARFQSTPNANAKWGRHGRHLRPRPRTCRLLRSRAAAINGVWLSFSVGASGWQQQFSLLCCLHTHDCSASRPSPRAGCRSKSTPDRAFRPCGPPPP